MGDSAHWHKWRGKLNGTKILIRGNHDKGHVRMREVGFAKSTRTSWPISKGRACRTIRRIAERHVIGAERNDADRLAAHFSRLAGDDTTLDEVELLLVHLGQRGLISGNYSQKLHAAYLREKRAVAV